MAPGPEILAPAGDQRSLRAALQAGADAVYFGLAEGWNARARAGNVHLRELPETVKLIHRAGTRAYLALNTLVFDDELAAVEDVLRQAAQAGIDAVILQDPAVALLAQRVCPSLPLHASTQMTLPSPDAARFATGLGCSRVIAPRELSVEQLRALSSSGLEVEAFVHGALCLSWSGQCLASLTFGGRSANRGRCAHPCRLPYQVFVDGQPVPARRHPLSPRDLAGERAVPALGDAGVVALKIEGRQKGPAYVMTAVRAVQGARDGGGGSLERDLGACAAVFSRGFGAGYLEGPDHQALVDGDLPGHIGAPLGCVQSVRGRDQLVVRCDGAPVGGPRRFVPPAPNIEPRPGQGIAILCRNGTVIGGTLHAVTRGGTSLVLRFGRPGPSLDGVTAGDRVFVNGDPALEREAEALSEAPAPGGRIGVQLQVWGRAGAPLRATARSAAGAVEACSSSELAPARGAALDRSMIEEKLGALGGTPFRLESCSVELEGALHLPVSELKALRRALAERLTAVLDAAGQRAVSCEPALPVLDAGAAALASRPGEPQIVVLCRTAEQIEAAAAAGVVEVELEARHDPELRRMVDLGRARGLGLVLASLRVDVPGADRLAAQIRSFAPEGVLVRNPGALMRLGGSRTKPLRLHGDAALNAANRLSARVLLEAGLETIVPALDVDEGRLPALCGSLPVGRSAVTLQSWVALFHTEHCLLAHLLGSGATPRDCGRPCDGHELALQDRRGQRHTLWVDAACRNTVFAGQARELEAGLLPRLLAAGVRRFRIELLHEDGDATLSCIRRWAALARSGGAAG